jgi:hypothetical protein
MDKIPTAKQYLQDYGLSEVMSESDLIEFAKLHLKAQREAIKENIKVDSDEYGNLSGYKDKMEESIDNAYPETNIL